MGAQVEGAQAPPTSTNEQIPDSGNFDSGSIMHGMEQLAQVDDLLIGLDL
jgi:hypothetical protein